MSGRALLTLINDILDLSKVEAGKLDLEYTAVNPYEVFAEMETIFSQKISEKGLDFPIEIDPDLPGALILDEVRLRQILVNLISNGIKFTDKGHVRLSVRSLYPEEDRSKLDLVFEVEDTGIGIPEDQIGSVFAAFEQQKDQSHVKYGGTGLGLAISKRLVEMMGGEISLTSEMGKGSIFHIVLKGVKVASVSDLESRVEPAIDVEAITFDHATILIADDIEVNRNLVKGYLEAYDFNLLEAENGEEAIDVTKAHHPDLVLMDMKMPVLDGYEAIERIKVDESIRDIPVVALTALGMKEEEGRVKNICDSYLRKPVSKVELVAELARFLPHTLNVKPSESKEEDQIRVQTPDADTLEKLPELVKILEEELNTHWSTLKDTSLINEVEEFGLQMQELGKKYNYQQLADWGEKLQAQAQMFELDTLPKTLEEFPQIIEEAQSLTQK